MRVHGLKLGTKLKAVTPNLCACVCVWVWVFGVHMYTNVQTVKLGFCVPERTV